MKYFRLLIGIGAIGLSACHRNLPTASTPAAPQPIIDPLPTISPPSISTTTPLASPNPLIPGVIPLPTPVISVPPLPTQVGDYQVIDELKQPQFMAQSRDILKAASLPNTKVKFNAADLLVVLKSTRKYFSNRLESDLDLQREGILATQGVKVSDVLKTLDFMVLTIQQDLKAKDRFGSKIQNF